MEKYTGLEDQRWYKIISVGDNTVITLQENKLVCLPDDSEKKDLQRFQAKVQDEGYFRLASRFQKSTEYVQVLDYLPHRSLVISKKQSAAEISTQIWKSEAVPELDCVFFVLSVPNPTKCLKNANSSGDKSTGQQIKVVEKTAEVIADPFAHWKLEAEPLA